ncbi:MAG: M48 family metalloprotease [Xanthomonadales bacterium]|nr:M48 family metalloprotease [Xanthomonadales bacterium]
MKTPIMQKFLVLVASALLALAACSVNPVTGERTFQIYGSEWEQQVGAQMYAPMKQSQGGEFILDPDLSAYVREVGDSLAARARRGDAFHYEFSIINDSTPNAWALPGGKIVVNRGLLVELDSEAELAAVLGHEIVHADAAHGARAQSKGMLTQLGAVASMMVLGSTIESAAARDIAMMVPQLGAQLLTQKYGRDAEREADEYGMRYMAEAGYDPQGAVDLQKTFLQLSEARDPDWLSGLFASHPPSRERLANNRETAASIGVDGERGEARYQRATAYLRRVQPAYDAYDEATQAEREGRSAEAQQLLDRAMAIEPRESLFHALQGDLYAKEDRKRQALAAYEQTVARNPGLFYGHLRKGQMEYELNRPAAAKRSLDRSLELLPTGEAHYLLGLMDKQQGRVPSALEHFEVAAQSESETGRKARREMALLDLAGNPSRYIEVQAAVDRSNAVWAVVSNHTAVAVRDIRLRHAWLDEQGRSREGSVVLEGPLAAGARQQVPLDVTLENAEELSRRVRVEVTAARVAE